VLTLGATAIDYFTTDRRQQAYDLIQPDSIAGGVGAEAYAFSQSAANTLTGGFFDANQKGGAQGVGDYAVEQSGYNAAKKSYNEATREGGDAGLAMLYGVEAVGKVATVGLTVVGVKQAVSTPKAKLTTEKGIDNGGNRPDDVGNSVGAQADAELASNPSRNVIGADGKTRAPDGSFAKNSNSKASNETSSSGSGKGRRGNEDTRLQLEGERDKFLEANPEYQHVAGGRDQVTGAELPEEFIPGPNGGAKGSSYPDLTFEGPTGNRQRINTVDADKNGIMTDRESINLYRIYEQTGEPVIGIPKKVK
jgi:hypothetical protein